MQGTNGYQRMLKCRVPYLRQRYILILREAKLLGDLPRYGYVRNLLSQVSGRVARSVLDSTHLDFRIVGCALINKE